MSAATPSAGLLGQVRSTWPLTRRLLGSGKRRNVLIAVLIALSLVFYCLYVAFLDVTYRESAALAAPLDLPCDVVLWHPAGIEPADLEATTKLYLLSRSIAAVMGPAATGAGVVDLLVLPVGAGSLELGPLLTGAVPEPGQCLLPLSLAGSAGLGVGDSLSLLSLSGPGAAGPAGLPAASVVAGVYEPRDPWLAVPVLVLEPGQFAAAGPATMVFMWVSHPESFLPRVVDWLRARYTPATVPGSYLAQQPILPLVLTADTAGNMMRTLSRNIHLPGGEAMFLLYLFFGVGIFTLMILTFLERRRELAVMKTLGLTSGQVAVALYLEVLIVAAGGLLLGWLLLAIGIGPAGRWTGQNYRLSAWILASGSFLSVLALLLSVWVPIAMARLATVANLLGGQPFRLAGYERRWGTGKGDAQTAADHRHRSSRAPGR